MRARGPVGAVSGVVLLLLAALPAQAGVPLPPQALDFRWVDDDPATQDIVLTWRAPVDFSTDIEHYNVYHVVVGDVPTPSPAVSTMHRSVRIDNLAPGAHVFFVTAVADGFESAPSNPVVVPEDWFSCTPVVPVFDPRDVIINRDCINGP